MLITCLNFHLIGDPLLWTASDLNISSTSYQITIAYIYISKYLCNNLLVNNIISTTAKSQVPTQTKNKLTNKEKKKVSRSQSWQ